MNVLNFLFRLMGRPELLPNGYPDVIEDVTRRVNGGGFYFPQPPPPPIPQYPTHQESPETPMVSEAISKIKKDSPRKHPSSTSSLSEAYYDRWCGTTVTDIYSTLTKPKDPLTLDPEPLKRFLTKKFPWVLNVTEVRIRPNGGASLMREIKVHTPNTVIFGPLEIYITVSPIHHSELMNPKIEKKVRQSLYTELLPLITCMYEHNHSDKPIVIFSPEPTETILEYI